MAGCGEGEGRVGGTGCVVCSAGKFAVNETCLNCFSGFHQPASGKLFCESCEAGRFQSEPGQSNCSLCGPGKKSNDQGTYCESCPQGKFSLKAENAECIQCVAGTYQPNTNATTCIECLAGNYSTSNAITCDSCPPGRVSQKNATSVCLLCPRGTYQDTPGLTFCLDCQPGFYSASPSSPACLSCLPGTYQNITRQSSCNVCGIGSMQSEPQATACVQCDPGRVSDSFASTSCHACASGRFSNTTGASACALCSRGRAQLMSGAQGCVLCPSGYYTPVVGLATCMPCESGYFQNVSGASSCQACPVGTFGNSKAAIDCRECAPGTFQSGVGQQRCFECNPGLYQSESAAVSCLTCPLGTVSIAGGSFSCTPCPSGTYSSPQASVCLSCPSNSIQPFEGQAQCVKCGEGSSPNVFGTGCQCRAGFYSTEIVNGTFQGCIPCPPGAGVCDSDGKTFAAVTTLSGWWRANVNATTFYRCVTPLFCLGNDVCGEFRYGPMCALCVEGYRSGGVGDACSACPASKSTSWGITVAIVLVLVLLLVVLYYIALRVANAQQHRLIHIVNLNNTLAQQRLKTLIAKDDAYFEDQRKSHRLRTQGGVDAVTTDEFETEEEPVDEERYSAPEIKLTVEDTSRRAPNFMYKVKILIGFFQIASYLPSQGDIAWPQAFFDFISAFAIFNFDFIPWQTLGCAAGINYFVKTLVVGAVPVVAALVLASAFFISSLIADTNSLETQLVRGQRHRAYMRQFIRLLLFTSFLLYPLVSKIALGVYNCVTIDGVSYLIADFELLCYDETWRAYAVIDGFFVAIYPIGIPIAYFLILASRRKHMREPETILVLGFLYEAYTEAAWYWELVDMTHKLILTSVIVFAPNEQRMAWNMGIMGVYLMALLVVVPYVRKGDDRFHLQVQATLFCIAFVGFILRQDDKPYESAYASPSDMESLIAALLICIVVLLLVSFVVMSGRNVRKIIRHRKRDKEKVAREIARMNGGASVGTATGEISTSNSSSNYPVGQKHGGLL